MRKQSLIQASVIGLSLALAIGSVRAATIPSDSIIDGSLRAQLTDASREGDWELDISWGWKQPDAAKLHGGELLLCKSHDEPNNECTLIAEFGNSSVPGSNVHVLTSSNWRYPALGQFIRVAPIYGPWSDLRWTGEQEEVQVPALPPLPPSETYGPVVWIPIVQS